MNQKETIKTDKPTIKNWFKTGLKPTQAQFWATWDSYWHKDDQLPMTAIEGLATAVDGKAPLKHDHLQYASNDATSLTPQNITQWKDQLGVANLEFTDQAISLTQAYPSLGLDGSEKQADFNQRITYSLAYKMDQPDEEGDSTEYPYLIGVDEDGSSALLKVEHLGSNMANANLVLEAPRKHTGEQMELAMPLIFSNKEQQFSGLIDRSFDRSFNKYMVSDVNGNIGTCNLSVVHLVQEIPTQIEMSNWRIGDICVFTLDGRLITETQRTIFLGKTLLRWTGTYEAYNALSMDQKASIEIFDIY